MHPPSPPLTWVSEKRNTQGWPAPPAWRVMRFRSSRHSVVVYDLEIWTANPTSRQHEVSPLNGHYTSHCHATIINGAAADTRPARLISKAELHSSGCSDNRCSTASFLHSYLDLEGLHAGDECGKAGQ
jgi:hypothetical protein